MKFVQSFRIRFTESDRHARAMPVALFDLLQETAIAHSSSAGRGSALLHARNLAWMMNRAHLRFERYPATGTEVTVTTWANCLTGLYAVREWTIEDAEGVCLRASGRWIMFDAGKSRIVKIPPDFAQAYGELPERSIDDSFDRMTPIEEGETSRLFHVRISDLDTNQHANSACYVDWALEAVPEDVGWTRRPLAIEVLFKKESVLGEAIESIARPASAAQRETLVFEHTVRGADGTVRAAARSVWPTAESFRE